VRALATLATSAVVAALTAVPAYAASAAHMCHGFRATIVGTAGDDTIIGTAARDVIVGLDGDDTIDGGAGKDVICGNDGGDVLTGGSGDDKVYGGYDGEHRRGEYIYDTGDTISGGPGDDLLDLGDDERHPSVTHIGAETLSYADSATGVHLDLAKGRATGEGHDTIVQLRLIRDQELVVLGSPVGDVIKGTARKDRINPLQGDDEVFGRGGADRIEENGLIPPRPLPNGNDVFHGGPGHDHLDSSDGHDVLDGSGGADALVSTSPAATLDGGAGRDFLSAGSVDSPDSATIMQGGRDGDRLQLRDPGEGTEVDGGAGRDRLELTDDRTDPIALDLSGSIERGGTTVPVGRVDSWRVTTAGSAAEVRGTSGVDRLVLYLTTHDVPVTASLGAGADRFWDRGVGSLDVSMGAGADRLLKSGRGGITALLGAGDDLVETSTGHWAIGPDAPPRTYDGGTGIDTAELDLDLPANSCTHIEKGNCP
jgi:Ca2+-binding RTX toxin-like protein